MATNQLVVLSTRRSIINLIQEKKGTLTQVVEAILSSRGRTKAAITEADLLTEAGAEHEESYREIADD